MRQLEDLVGLWDLLLLGLSILANLIADKQRR